MTQGATIDLAGRWHLAQGGGGLACDMDLPGDGICSLHAAGLIPDPYFGRNEYDLRWISQVDWVLSRSVTLDDPAVVLEVSGVDTLATIRWNGQEVLQTANAFRSYRADLRGVAVAGENRIEITFHSAPAEADRLAAAQPFVLPYTKNCPIPNGNLLRKPQCDFGWDWNIALAPFGLYGRIALVPAAAARIGRVMVTQDHSDGAVEVGVTACVDGAAGADWAMSLAGQTAQGTVDGPTITARFRVTNPALWWPAGHGAQPLHDLSLSVAGTTATRRIGLRRIALVTEQDDTGLGFRFRVNGRDIFAKGANWIPADALAGRITRDGVEGLLRSAVDANMNMIRVWGGGRYEPDWFYDLCDEMGLMVWQDFMFACNIYPSDPAFLAEVTAEVEENVARLHHHACLALWCGDNELIGALSWYPQTRANRDRYLVNYDRLNRTIEAALKRTDPGAPWWPSSPSPGPMSFGDAWHDDGSGDMHFWSVWHEGRDFDHYRDVSPRFCSEFGFQSYPSMEVIRRFADPSDFNIAAPVLESHQKDAGGNARIAETMFRYFRFPARFDDFVYLSQVQQGLAIKTAVTQWRSLRPHCMGTLIWQLNDTWPVCSWSSLDHGGGWKLLHHMARHFFAPVTVAAVPVEGAIELRGVNDGVQPVELTVSARATDMAGQTRDLGRTTVTVNGSATPVLGIPQGALGPQEMLAFTWETAEGIGGDDLFAPQPYKAYALRAPGLALTDDETDGVWHLTITAKALALFVAVEADQPGRFSDNAFALFPGAPAHLTFTPAVAGPAPTFTLRDLHSATFST